MCIISGGRAECMTMHGLDEENMSNSLRTYTTANQRNAPPTYTDTVSLYIIHLLTMNIYMYIPSTGTCNYVIVCTPLTMSHHFTVVAMLGAGVVILVYEGV